MIFLFFFFCVFIPSAPGTAFPAPVPLPHPSLVALALSLAPLDEGFVWKLLLFHAEFLGWSATRQKMGFYLWEDGEGSVGGKDGGDVAAWGR